MQSLLSDISVNCNLSLYKNIDLALYKTKVLIFMRNIIQRQTRKPCKYVTYQRIVWIYKLLWTLTTHLISKVRFKLTRRHLNSIVKRNIICFILVNIGSILLFKNVIILLIALSNHSNVKYQWFLLSFVTNDH